MATEFGRFEPRALPATTARLRGTRPQGPPGAIFVLAGEGGFAAPAGPCVVRFGRGRDGVQVAVGRRDPYISRLHGTLACEQREWWLHNAGRLPIQLPGETMVLAGRRLPLAPGYTRLLIRTPRKITYSLEVYVVAEDGADPDTAESELSTNPESAALSELERLVLVVLAQRYLRRERYPLPVSWSQVAADLNRVSRRADWSPRAAADVVDAVRERLSFGDVGAAGSVLNHRLIRALLRNTALLPADLHLLDEETLPPATDGGAEV